MGKSFVRQVIKDECLFGQDILNHLCYHIVTFPGTGVENVWRKSRGIRLRAGQAPGRLAVWRREQGGRYRAMAVPGRCGAAEREGRSGKRRS